MKTLRGKEYQGFPGRSVVSLDGLFVLLYENQRAIQATNEPGVESVSEADLVGKRRAILVAGEPGLESASVVHASQPSSSYGLPVCKQRAIPATGEPGLGPASADAAQSSGSWAPGPGQVRDPDCQRAALDLWRRRCAPACACRLAYYLTPLLLLLLAPEASDDANCVARTLRSSISLESNVNHLMGNARDAVELGRAALDPVAYQSA